MHISIHTYLQIYRETGPHDCHADTRKRERNTERGGETESDREREREREEEGGGLERERERESEKERDREREDLKPATLINVAGGIIADAMPMRNIMCEVALVRFIRSRPPHISECVM